MVLVLVVALLTVVEVVNEGVVEMLVLFLVVLVLVVLEAKVRALAVPFEPVLVFVVKGSIVELARTTVWLVRVVLLATEVAAKEATETLEVVDALLAVVEVE